MTIDQITPAAVAPAAAPATATGPLVSVVIVCYNQARYLGDAIGSVLAQTYPRLEVLVVDDGSTDATAEVAASCPDVRYIFQTNRGLAAARNTGLRHSTGEAIIFLDADDRLLSRAAQAGVDQLRESPEAAFVFGGYRNIFDDGSAAPTDPPQNIQKDHYLHLLEGNFIGMHATVMYRRAALAAAGGFDESLKACEDYELYLRLARRLPIGSHGEIIAEYRQHDTNMSKDYAFMLRSVLSVLRMERPLLSGAANHEALHRGVRVWKDYYGNLLLQEWQRTRGIGRFLRILRLCPRQVARRAYRSLQRRLRGKVRFGSLRRLAPFSRRFGLERGQPIDRHYIESFLADHERMVHGRVLEIGDDAYSRRYGSGSITRQDVLHVAPGFPGATIIADLASAPHIPSESFDCIILTQTMQYIFDLPSATATLLRILRPGGAVLVTLPGISQISRDQQDKERDCWRFTASSARRMFEREFGEGNVEVRTYGNVLASIAFLEGLAAHDLTQQELDAHDPDYQLVVAVAAVKRGEEGCSA